MAARSDKNISELMQDADIVTAALGRGVREAMVQHIRAGLPMVEWRDGKSVWVQPDEIQRRLQEMDKQKQP